MPAGCLNTRETRPGCKLKQHYGRGGVSAACLVSCFLVCQVWIREFAGVWDFLVVGFWLCFLVL